MKFSYRRQTGAVLLTVLVVMTMIILLVATASTIMNSRLNMAYDAKRLIEKKAIVHEKMNEIIYLASTQRFTVAGLSTGKNIERLSQLNGQWLYSQTNDELRVDGFTNKEQVSIAGREESTLFYALQSGNGLIPVNTSSSFWLEKWLTSHDIGTSQRRKYIDTLHDYIDSDSSTRPMGAEYMDYPQNTPMALPTNYYMQDCSELSLLQNWDELTKKEPSILQECSTEYGSSLNINAIPERLLVKLWPEKAEQIMRKRTNGEWFLNIEGISLILNDVYPQDELLYRFATNRSLLVAVSFEGYTRTARVEFGQGLQKPFSMTASSIIVGK